MKITVPLALAASIAGAVAPAAAAQYFAAEPQRLGKVSQVLPPDYPPLALASRQTGFVDVEGIVHSSGRLSAVAYKPGSTTASVFVEPLQKVVPHWKFQPVLGEDCQPAAEKVTTRVEFALVDGAPKVYTLLPKDTLPSTRRFEQLRPVSSVAPVYPEMLRANGLEGTVYSKLTIDASGAVTQVSPKGYAEAVSDPARNEELAQAFARAAERALWRWTFPAAAGTEPRVFCAVSRFLLS